jgi:hypothetical protein
LASAIALAEAVAPAFALAQSYPSRPIAALRAML